MTVQRTLHAIAGGFVLASLLLAHFVSPIFLWGTAFVGANLLQSAVTNWCLMTNILRRVGLPEDAPSCAIPTAPRREPTSL